MDIDVLPHAGHLPQRVDPRLEHNCAGVVRVVLPQQFAKQLGVRPAVGDLGS